MEKSLNRLCDPDNNSINEKMSRVRRSFTDAVGGILAQAYLPVGERGKAKIITLPTEKLQLSERLLRLRK